MIIKIKKQLKCLRCSHEWNPKKIEVRICPKCKSAWWDKEKILQAPCLNCGKMLPFKQSDVEMKYGLNVFCPDKDCEDEYAFKK